MNKAEYIELLEMIERLANASRLMALAVPCRDISQHEAMLLVRELAESVREKLTALKGTP